MKTGHFGATIPNLKYLLPIFLLPIILSSCGNDLPSEKLAMEKMNDNSSTFPYEVTELKKTNGIAGKDKGQETYQMNFHAKLIARDSLYSFAKFMSDTINVLKTDTNRLKSLLFRSPFQSIHWERVSAFGKGDLVKEIDGVARFVKTENGWEIIK